MHSATLPKSYLQRVSPPPISKSRAAKKRRLNTSVDENGGIHQARSYTPVHSPSDLYESQPATETDLVNAEGAGLAESRLPRRSILEPSLDTSAPSSEEADQDEAQPLANLPVSTALAPAAIEAGRVTIADHLSYFVSHYQSIKSFDLLRPAPNLHLEHFRALFTRNSGAATGCHFVIHQHDHPRAGLHYDLRLQISGSSSASWSVPYGLPGNPNERKRYGRRQAIETRVHALWNHLVESAGPKTGSILIWDTGTYKVLPYDKQTSNVTDSEREDGDDGDGTGRETESQKLCTAFRAGKIRVQLQGSKLPRGYTIAVSLSPRAKRKLELGGTNPTYKRQPSNAGRLAARHQVSQKASRDSENEDEDADEKLQDINMNSDNGDDDGNTIEKEKIRTDNAYPGSHNTIGSVHQRWWFIHLDKEACGFMKGRDDTGKVLWRTDNEEMRRRYPFVVRGRDFERSVVTGRKAADVHRDEGSVGYVPRAGWQPILD